MRGGWNDSVVGGCEEVSEQSEVWFTLGFSYSRKGLLGLSHVQLLVTNF